MHTITRDYHFSAAHTIPSHPKCKRLHGHNYKVEVTVRGEPDTDGMIVDFGIMDKFIDPIIERLDHRYLVGSDEAAGDLYAALIERQYAQLGDSVCYLSVSASTVECIAEDLFHTIWDAITTAALLVSVTVWENHKSKATYSL